MDEDFTFSPFPVHRVLEVPAARFFQVKCITSKDEFHHWNEGPDSLRGAWKAKFYTVKPWSEHELLPQHFTLIAAALLYFSLTGHFTRNKK